MKGLGLSKVADFCNAKDHRKKKWANPLLVQPQRSRLSGTGTHPGRSLAEQVPKPGFPRLAPCLVHLTSCLSLTPPRKMLRKFPPCAHPGWVGRFCGRERTGEATESNSLRAVTAFAIPGGGPGVAKTPGPIPRDSGWAGQTARSVKPLSFLLVFPCDVAARGRPARRVSPSKKDCLS